MYASHFKEIRLLFLADLLVDLLESHYVLLELELNKEILILILCVLEYRLFTSIGIV